MSSLFLVLKRSSLQISNSIILTLLGKLNLVLDITTIVDTSSILTISIGVRGSWGWSVGF